MSEPASGRPLRGALIGYGFIAENGHGPAYLDREDGTGDLELVAVVDTCEARRDVARRRLPHTRVYPDHVSLLSDPTIELDFVDIAVPPCDHERIAHAALARGLHVLCEKPLATSPRAARAMLDHAARARRVIFPCHNYKHAPVIKAVDAALRADRIGTVHLVTLDTMRTTHAKGVAEWRPNWRRELAYAGGGIAMDHGSHTFYLTFDWMGSYPSAITAKTSSLGAFDTEDNFSCTITFPTGIARASLSWTSGVRKIIYTLHGDRGAIRVEDDDVEVATLLTPPGVTPARWNVERSSVASDWMDASHVHWFGSLLGQFRAAIDSDDFVGREARQALRSVQLIAKAYASAKNDCREVRLSSEPASERPGVARLAG